MQPMMPTAKNTMLQAKVAVQTVLLTETCGIFSLTQDGTVVTKPKLNRTCRGRGHPLLFRLC